MRVALRQASSSLLASARGGILQPTRRVPDARSRLATAWQVSLRTGSVARSLWTTPMAVRRHALLGSTPRLGNLGLLTQPTRAWKLHEPLAVSARSIFSRGASSDDLYEILETNRSASQQEIKKAYFKLAKRYHPDINPDDPNAQKMFHRIAAAYEVLGNAEKRHVYDMTGHHDNQQRFNQNASAAPGSDDFADQIFHKVWQDLGLKEYVEVVSSEASTAWEAARHGDFSFAKEFARERKGLILSAIVPLAIMLRFPGMLSTALRLLSVGALVFLRNIPPELAWRLMRNVWLRITRR